MSKLKVLEIIRQGKIGGGESHVIDVVSNIDRDQFEPVVLSFTDGPMIRSLEEKDIKCHVIYTETPFDFRKWGQIKKLIKQLNPDLIHAHGTRAMSNVFHVASSIGIPLIYTVHGWSFHDDQKFPVKQLRIQSEKYLISKADRVINVSQSNRDSGREMLGDYPSRVINNGIDLDKFNFHIDSGVELQNEMEIPNGKIIVGAINRMTHQKNPLGLIDAFHHAIKYNDRLHLLMVGEGELFDIAKNKVKALDLHDQITFTGNRKDIPRLLSLIDIFCLPSFWEGLSLGLLEAMAMKKAIIASRVDGTSEVIIHRQNGLLFDSGNELQLSSLLLELSENTDLCKSLGENAFKTVCEHHSVDTMVKSLEEEYLNIIENARDERDKDTGVFT